MTRFNPNQDKLRAAASVRPSAPLGAQSPSAAQGKPAVPEKLQSNGFAAEESRILHSAIELAGLRWFDGEALVMGKKDDFEVFFRPGQSANARWLVMGFPLYDMNLPNSAEVCLHFMAESFNMIHMLDFQYHVGINMETEILEFLVQLPLVGVNGPQLGELIKAFFETLSESVMNELATILKEMEQGR